MECFYLGKRLYFVCSYSMMTNTQNQPQTKDISALTVNFLVYDIRYEAVTVRNAMNLGAQNNSKTLHSAKTQKDVHLFI